jgi:hypothetical protein
MTEVLTAQEAGFLNNLRISIPSSNGQRTKTICGLVKHAGKFVFSKNDGQESTVVVRLFFSSGHSIRLTLQTKGPRISLERSNLKTDLGKLPKACVFLLFFYLNSS